jgi:hypothetical protein
MMSDACAASAPPDLVVEPDRSIEREKPRPVAIPGASYIDLPILGRKCAGDPRAGQGVVSSSRWVVLRRPFEISSGHEPLCGPKMVTGVL